jgi:hypothetical protein
MRHDLVVSFQKVSLEFTKPNSSCRDGAFYSFLGLFAVTHKSFSHSSSAILHEITTPISIKPEQS